MSVSLFERYGGFGQISKVVLAFYDKVADSEVIGHYFDHVDMAGLIDHQTKFIASIMGGPASYSNEALQRVHSGLAIDRASFEEMKSLLRETLEEFEFQEVDVETVMSEIESRAPIILSSDGR